MERPFVQQLFTMQCRNALIISLSHVLYGMQYLWASALNSSNNGSTPFTFTESVWLLSIYPIGESVSPLLTLLYGNSIGRKRILLVTLAALSCINVFLYSQTFYVILIIRTVSAVLLGFNCTMAPVLIGETSASKVRGKYLTLLAIQANLGLVCGFTIMGKFSMQLYNAILIVLPLVLFVLTYFFVMESPYYDVMVNKTDDALVSLKQLRLSNNAEEGLNMIQEFIQEQQKTPGFWKLIKKKQNRLSCLFGTGYQIANTITGIDFVLMYMYYIVERVTDSPLDEFHVSLLFSSSGLLICIITSMLIDSWGRRPLFILSSGLTSFFLFILGTYFCVLSYNPNVKHFGYLVIVCLILYKISISMGLSSLPKVCTGELFEPKFVHIGSSISRSLYHVSSFIIVLTNSYLLEFVGIGGIFLGLGTLCLLFGIGFTLIVPETKNKPLERIQLELKEYKLFLK